MDKKSFMRGFGTGVIFATVILGISCLMRTSDSEIIRRAKALGMDYVSQEEPLFSTAAPTSGAAATVTGRKEKAKATKAPKATATAKTEVKSEDVKQEKVSEELEKEKKKMKQETEKASREFTIKAGEWSDEVSRKLEAMDIISDADDFDKYLEEYGYSDDIKAGTFEVSADASFEEIARAITSR